MTVQCISRGGCMNTRLCEELGYCGRPAVGHIEAPASNLQVAESVCADQLRLVCEHGQPHGIRDRSGYLMFFPTVCKYEGQEERYRSELAQRFRLADFLLKSLQSAGETPCDRVIYDSAEFDAWFRKFCTWDLTPDEMLQHSYYRGCLERGIKRSIAEPGEARDVVYIKPGTDSMMTRHMAEQWWIKSFDMRTGWRNALEQSDPKTSCNCGPDVCAYALHGEPGNGGACRRATP